MKKVVVLLLLLTTLVAVPKIAYVATTLSFEQSINGNEIYQDNYKNKIFNDTLVTKGIHFAYINKMAIFAEYSYGDWMGGNIATTLGELQVGYPIVNEEKWLVYVTAGLLNNTKNLQNSDGKIDESSGNMFGVNIEYILTKGIHLEADLQYSVFGASYHLYQEKVKVNPDPPYDEIVYPAGAVLHEDIASVRLKILFILNDNLGLTISYRQIHRDVEGSTMIEDRYSSSIGLVYRF